MSGARPKDHRRRLYSSREYGERNEQVHGHKSRYLDQHRQYRAKPDPDDYCRVASSKRNRTQTDRGRTRRRHHSRSYFSNKFRNVTTGSIRNIDYASRRRFARGRELNSPNNYFNGTSMRNDVRKAGMCPLLVQDLMQILRKHSVNEVTETLSDKVERLHLLLNKDKLSDEIIEILLKIFVRVFKDKNSDSIKCVVGILQESTLLKKGLIVFVRSLGDNIEIDDKNENQMLKKIEGYVNLLIFFLSELFPKIEKGINDVAANVALLEVKCTWLFGVRRLSKDVLINVTRLKKNADKYTTEARAREKRKRQLELAEREGICEGPPPDDYRDIPILPTAEDLHSRELPFLRPNITKGSYSSIYHYLDIQFRLLREDFVSPLRDGIQTHIANLENPLPRGQKKRNTDVRLYYDVKIEHPVFTHREEGVLYRVKFSLCNLRRVKWHTTKRLIYGSLVCLSHDNFQTLLFGTVTERDDKLLRSGRVDIKLHNINNMDTERTYTMVESSAFYESYRPVLQVLQQIQEGSIPMENYIIHASHDIKQPKYLQGGQVDLKYDIRALVKNEVLIHASHNIEPPYLYRGLPVFNHNYRALMDNEVLTPDRQDGGSGSYPINIFDEDAWPDTDKLNIDASQLSAVKAALTKELAVIQGPPGTGKTYIGLKIVETLIINKAIWSIGQEQENRRNGSDAIMVICYTNHALDQFLEGILTFCPRGVVRIGGRSKSKKLEAFNLKRLAKFNCRTELSENAEFSQKTRESIRKQMIGAEEMIKLCDKYIISENSLENVMNKSHLQCLRDSREEYGVNRKRSTLPTWLGLLSEDPQQDDTNEDDDVDDKEYLDNEDIQDEEQNTKNTLTEIDVLLYQREYDGGIGKDCETEKETIIAKLSSALAYNPMKCKDAPLKKHRKMILNELSVNNDAMTREEANKISNIRKLSKNDRWRLYRYWIANYKVELRRVLFKKQQMYDQLVGDKVRQENHETKCRVLRAASIVGLTTTGAAKNKDLLKDIRPRIVIVEEAAEILEAHIVTSLTQQCEHLILIGDHQQLKPNPTVYKLATKFNLDTSLFERIINNGVPCQKLSSQHRMRPEIANIMRNHFYSNLLDDESVNHLGDVRGVSHNLFFINHTIQEISDDDILSKSNVHEAEYCVALAKYLVQQCYDATDITILTTYTGQVLNIKEILRNKKYDCLRGIYVSAVDNYQGEENKIILLSLVRSNDVGNIGFLKVSNRMCVALSRARNGLYCIGNFNLLAGNNNLWMKIVKDMRSSSRVANHLELYCQNHPKTIIQASAAKDFDQCPLGGCMLKCETRLDCGHACRLLCHPRDSNHMEYECQENCVRTCVRGHGCTRKCFQMCSSCTVTVCKTLDCQHEVQIECHMFDEPILCTQPCGRQLKCSHKCKQRCFEVCTTKCLEVVTRLFVPCHHKIEVQCHVNSCQVPCDKYLTCGHSCKKKCGDSCTSKCVEIVEKSFECGHIVIVPCFTPTCTMPCPRKRTCGHSCPKQCGDECGNCLVEVNKELTCGHQKLLECHEDVEIWSTICRMECSKTLSCGHQCTLKCYKTCSASLCTELVKKKLICNHEKELPCNVDPITQQRTSSLIVRRLQLYGLNGLYRFYRTNPDSLCCSIKVDATRKCGHETTIECWKASTVEFTNCKDIVVHKFACGHKIKIECWELAKITSIKCTEKVVETLTCGHEVKRVCSQVGVCNMKCTKLLPCGHTCKKICSEPCTDKCTEKVEKQLKCEHNKIVSCFVDVSQIVREGEAACHVKKTIPLPCGHKETQLCYQSDLPVTCKQQCKRTLACGHLCTKMCAQVCSSVESCRERCKSNLRCGHRCRGVCKDCLNVNVHKECTKPCKKRLICGHNCKQYCSLLPCQPCKQQCVSCCWHRGCQRTCAEVCEPCKSACEWQCRHFKCTKACDEMCDRPRCNYPCLKTLICRHKCFALCGEPCLCLTCLPANYVSSTTAKRHGKKYVFLFGCDHVIEVSEMDQYMDKDEGIQRKRCPICDTIITYLPRYGNVLKTIEMRISAVKRLILVERSMKHVQDKRKKILLRLAVLKTVDQKNILQEINSRYGISHERLLSVDMIITLLERVETIRVNLNMLDDRDETSSGDILNQLRSIEEGALIAKNIFSEQYLTDICARLQNLKFDNTEKVSGKINFQGTLVEVAKEYLDKYLSFCRDDWSTCYQNHVFRAAKKGIVPKCQECAILEDQDMRGYDNYHLGILSEENENNTEQNPDKCVKILGASSELKSHHSTHRDVAKEFKMVRLPAKRQNNSRRAEDAKRPRLHKTHHGRKHFRK